LKISLNNYLCFEVWFQQFQEIIISQSPFSTQRLVTYFLICKVINEIFKGDFYENKNI